MSNEPRPGTKEKAYTVSQIAHLIKTCLETTFPSVWVEGELSKVLDHTSGHLYLTLKQERDVLDATLWRTARKALKFKPEPGQQVLVRGRISSYGPYGKYQLIVDRIEPAGLGALQVQFEQLKKKLGEKGYFDEGRKKPLPAYPKTIGVVTSSTGAAFRDIARILHRRDPGVRIILAPVLVEGEQAKTQIASAIDDLNRYDDIDLMIVGRGGGSPESLWAFNEEVVAEAIYRSKIPVISAVGHEIDFTIADFVADLRASTPSAAAELAVKNRADTERTLQTLSDRMTTALVSYLRDLRGMLSAMTQRPIFTDPTRFLENDRQRVDENFMRIVNGIRRHRVQARERMSGLAKQLKTLKPSMLIERKKEYLNGIEKEMARNLSALLERRREQIKGIEKELTQNTTVALREKQRAFALATGGLNALSPLKVLGRGYSITRKANGEVVKDEAQTKTGDRLELLLHKGRLSCRVEEKHPPATGKTD